MCACQSFLPGLSEVGVPWGLLLAAVLQEVSLLRAGLLSAGTPTSPLLGVPPPEPPRGVTAPCPREERGGDAACLAVTLVQVFPCTVPPPWWGSAPPGPF